MITSIYDVNPSYLMKIQGTDENGDSVYIVGCLEDSFAFGVGSGWEPLLPNINVVDLLVKGEKSSLAAGLLRGVGYNPTSQYASNLAWTGTSPIAFDLNITFFALSNAEAEVLGPSMRALSLSLPSQVMDSSSTGSSVVNNLVVKTPGPALIKNVANAYSLDLYIGRIYHFPNIIVTHANVSNKSVFGADGLYLVSTVSIGITTSTIYTKTDLQKVVGTRYQGTNSTGLSNGGLISSLF